MAENRYLVLARKWRPQCFDDVVGQDHITRTLCNAISSGRIHHAFLFIGSRGIGKTTTARILAKALNCAASSAPTITPCGVCENCRSISEGSNIDVIEIDGASNNSVDDVREIRENVRMVPTSGRYKVYIIDEVHQLSTAAFNALLKTLEEPPPHAIFVLATTEAHKIPATIISRCQRYDFRRVPIGSIIDLLRKILEKEQVKASDEALHAIARAAEGGVRDAESILDQLISYCDAEITFKDVFDVLGLVDWHVLHALCDAVLAKDVARLLMLVEEVVANGKDLSQFVQEILRYFRNLLVCKTANSTDLLHLPEEELREVQQRAQRFTLTGLIRMVEQFAELTSGFDSQLAQRIALESLLIRVSKAGIELSVDTILEKLLLLEAGGVAIVPPSRPPDPPPAGPVESAPAAPAEPRRITLSGASLGRQWPVILQQVAQSSLNLGIWLGKAEPAGLEDDALVLRFPAGAAQARTIIDKPENRGVLEGALSQLTDNVRRFRTELVQEAPKAAPVEAPPGNQPFLPAISPEDAKLAMEEPVVAKVLDVFKGLIVDIRHPAAPDKPE